ncbi:N-acetylglucosamine-6-phosphate deacetylase [Terriglobus aquaticus]|uniref:N-acetylglucosamine-6-phosphate deacetylase n=1 Tax=Terriglobus aquaticus TaxID=940139 RepID=A0ABW9KN74_9BACT|nr:N-acetylglucosamine-6-phosphate deacetylase [Terriglobus aquaticus]
MPHTAITAARLLLPNGALNQPLLFVRDGVVERISTRAEAELPANTLDLGDATLAPGFLDVHVHGAGGRDVMEGTQDAVETTACMLARFGTTSFLATTVTAPIDHTLSALEALADSIESEPTAAGARPIGIHLEGPFISHAKRGVHPVANILPPSIGLFDRFQQAARGHIRLMTIAPETEGATELIAHAAASGVRLSMGHSNATAAETRSGIATARRAAPTQAVSATHTFNAMRALDHREPGILGVTLDDADLFAELICDGIHTTPEAVRLWFRSKGENRAILVTDGMAATGMPDGDYKLGELDVTVRDGVCTSSGVLAGSVLTMQRAVANLQAFTGASLATAVRLATHNPAALLGLADEQAGMVPGAEASFTVFDKAGAFRGTVLRGEHLPFA